MDIKHDIIDDIRTQQLIWHGHVQRMPQHRIPKKSQVGTPKEEGKEEDHARAGERELIVKFGKGACKMTCGEIERGGDLESEDVKRCNPDI